MGCLSDKILLKKQDVALNQDQPDTERQINKPKQQENVEKRQLKKNSWQLWYQLISELQKKQLLKILKKSWELSLINQKNEFQSKKDDFIQIYQNVKSETGGRQKEMYEINRYSMIKHLKQFIKKTQEEVKVEKKVLIAHLEVYVQYRETQKSQINNHEDKILQKLKNIKNLLEQDQFKQIFQKNQIQKLFELMQSPLDQNQKSIIKQYSSIKNSSKKVLPLKLNNQAEKFKFKWDFSLKNSRNFNQSGSKIVRVGENNNYFYQLTSVQNLDSKRPYLISFKILKNEGYIVIGIVNVNKKQKAYSGDVHHFETVGFWTQNNGLGCVYVNGQSKIEWTPSLGTVLDGVIQMTVDMAQQSIIFNRKANSKESQSLITPIRLPESFNGKQFHIFIAMQSLGDTIQLI